MRFLRSLLFLAGALAVLSLGAVNASASPREAPPCHEMGAGAPGQPQAPAKVMKAMICCVACVAAPAVPAADVVGRSVAAGHPAARPFALPAGRRLTPEPAPPRPSIA